MSPSKTLTLLPTPTARRAAPVPRRTAWLGCALLVASLAACNRAPDAPPPANADATVTPAATPSAAAPAEALARAHRAAGVGGAARPSHATYAAGAGDPSTVDAAYPPSPAYEPARTAAAVPAPRVDYRPPLAQPEPVAVPWAPPPLLAEVVPAAPSPDAYWVGGYWMWRDGWAWTTGRWELPPRPLYRWVPPCYEHRQDRVVFVNGFWAAPGVVFQPPPAGLPIALAVAGAGIAIALGHAPVGPQGFFLPPPPGSLPGLVVPAPPGTPPAVLLGAPPIAAPGMRVRVAQHIDSHDVTIDNRTTVIDNRVYNHIDNRVDDARHFTHVSIQAPASTTVDHRAVDLTVPAQPPQAGSARPAMAAMAPPQAGWAAHAPGAAPLSAASPAHAMGAVPLPPGTPPTHAMAMAAAAAAAMAPHAMPMAPAPMAGHGPAPDAAVRPAPRPDAAPPRSYGQAIPLPAAGREAPAMRPPAQALVERPAPRTAFASMQMQAPPPAREHAMPAFAAMPPMAAARPPAMPPPREERFVAAPRSGPAFRAPPAQRPQDFQRPVQMPAPMPHAQPARPPQAWPAAMVAHAPQAPHENRPHGGGGGGDGGHHHH